MKKILFLIFGVAALTCCNAKDFVVASPESSTTIIAADNDWQGVKRAAGDLCEDVKRVTGS